MEIRFIQAVVMGMLVFLICSVILMFMNVE